MRRSPDPPGGRRRSVVESSPVVDPASSAPRGPQPITGARRARPGHPGRGPLGGTQRKAARVKGSPPVCRDPCVEELSPPATSTDTLMKHLYCLRGKARSRSICSAFLPGSSMISTLRSLALIVASAFFVLTPAARGNGGFNVDFGTDLGVPAAGYGAASGQAGSWNQAGLGSTALANLSGGASSVSVNATFPMWSGPSSLDQRRRAAAPRQLPQRRCLCQPERELLGPGGR